MALFATDLEALSIIGIIAISLYLFSKVFAIMMYRIKKLKADQRNKILFGIRVLLIIVIVFLLLEGFPSFEQIPPEYTAVLTGAISTALAFASSEIFSNFMAGVLLFIIDPFDLGDVVKIQGYKGIIKEITLTKVVLQTFDNVIVDLSNNDIVSSKMLNYTTNLKKVKTYPDFKKLLLSPQDVGNAHLDYLLFEDEEKKDAEMMELYNTAKAEKFEDVHAFTFKMRVDYDNFRIKVDKMDKVCGEYKEKFGYKPRFHIIDFEYDIFIKFRIITLDANKLADFQPEFAKDIYKIVLSSEV